MKTALFGALLAAAGVAAQIVAGQHHPSYVTRTFLLTPEPVGWSHITYDLVRIGGWALLIFGAVIVALALVREFRVA